MQPNVRTAATQPLTDRQASEAEPLTAAVVKAVAAETEPAAPEAKVAAASEQVTTAVREVPLTAMVKVAMVTAPTPGVMIPAVREAATPPPARRRSGQMGAG